MACDLEQIFDGLVVQLPNSLDRGEGVILSAENLPIPPERLASDRLHIQAGTAVNRYTFGHDTLEFNARKETYSQLGLLFLAVIFHPLPSRVVLELTQPRARIKNLVIEHAHSNLEDRHSGYHTRPHGFVYYPRQMEEYPFPADIAPYDLPRFGLTVMNYDIAIDRKMRDTVISFGNGAGSALFAELLLNAGQPDNPRESFHLKVESIYRNTIGEFNFRRGVGIGSAEVSVLLPRHTFFDLEFLEWLDYSNQ